MVNLWERVSRECFGEVEPVFQARMDGGLASEACRAKLEEILGRRKVPGAESLAIFLSTVANGIAYEEVPERNPEDRLLDHKWCKKADGLYILSTKAIETNKALQGM